ncbi:helix-turn-helix domain-containing protein [Nocardia macrotermitis]|uniref:helix-turn-helix domain-containing protein n=1 Tax=Nocardia macrotermitis TaxID=2585198 RepID=UPI0029E8156E|nr:helix-turn-helix domain-containing protein [Nocardia macrotermitis]
MQIDPPPRYRERPSRTVPGATVWTRTIGPADDAPVLPDGCMDLLWLGGRLVVAGPDTRAYSATAAPGTRISGIRFFPGTAPALLGVPARELLDRRAELDDLWRPARVRPLTEFLAAAADPLIGLDRIAGDVAAEANPADPALGAVVRGLGAGASVAALAASLGLGERRLHRMSLSAFGYGPKMLGRVLRLQRALTLARAGIPFAETAFRAGYADQAHLAREVRELAGTSLARLLTRDRTAQAGGQASGA